MGLEEAGGVPGRQGHSQVPEALLVMTLMNFLHHGIRVQVVGLFTRESENMESAVRKRYKRSAAVVTSVFAALLLLLFASTSASAYNPGEGSTWTPETENGQLITSTDTVDDARDPHNGNLVEIWHAASDSRIWVSLNHGPAIVLPNATTLAAPRIAYYGGHFHVFHTGTDGHIYTQQVVFRSSTELLDPQPTFWTALPNGALTRNNLSPSVVSFPLEHDNDAMVSWGSATDDLQYTMYWNGSAWEEPAVVPYVRSTTANTLAWNDIYDEISLAHRGNDGQAYISYQPWGSSQWTVPEQMPTSNVVGTPDVAWASNGQGTIAINAGDSILVDHLQRPGQHDGGWNFENTTFPTDHNPQLVASGLTIIIILTRQDTHGVYYKPITVFTG